MSLFSSVAMGVATMSSIFYSKAADFSIGATADAFFKNESETKSELLWNCSGDTFVLDTLSKDSDLQELKNLIYQVRQRRDLVSMNSKEGLGILFEQIRTTTRRVFGTMQSSPQSAFETRQTMKHVAVLVEMLPFLNDQEKAVLQQDWRGYGMLLETSQKELLNPVFAGATWVVTFAHRPLYTQGNLVVSLVPETHANSSLTRVNITKITEAQSMELQWLHATKHSKITSSPSVEY